MQKVNTPNGPVWMNLHAAKVALAGQSSVRPEGLLGPIRHASNPETKKGYEAAASFYQSGGSVSSVSIKKPSGPAVPPKKKEIEIDLSKFIPYNEEEEMPKVQKKSKSLEVGGTPKGEFGEIIKPPVKEAKKEEEKYVQPEINTEGVADMIKELKEKKEVTEEEKETNEVPVEQVHAVRELSDVDLVETLYGRLLRLKQVEAELEEMKKKYREAEITAEQLVIKLGKEKEHAVNLEEQVKSLTQHNTKLTVALEKQDKIIKQLQQQHQSKQPEKVSTTRLW